MCLGDVGQQGATLAAGRVSEWLVLKVERLNGLFSVVSTSWQPLEDRERKGRLLSLLSVSVEEEKSRQVGGLRSCC